MNNLVVTPVADANEFAEAYALALSVFTENTSMEGYREYKLFNWTDDPWFNYHNILLARYRGEPAGLIRIVPRILYRGNEPFSVAGISSVCLLPKFRGAGLSVPLMEQSLEYCSARGYDIAFLFARRAADHYYTRFGFHGIASYSRVFITQTLYTGKRNLSVSAIDHSLYHIYNAAYEYSYANCFGRFERTDAYWKYIITSALWRKEFRFYTIRRDDIAIGYVIAGDTNIHEVAVNTDLSGVELIHLLMNNLAVNHANNKLEIEILPQHRLLNSLQGNDITLQSRECTYGGRMVKILNKKILSYQETCALLGVFSPTNSYDTEGALPFDIGSIDHF